MSCYHPLLGRWTGKYTDNGKKEYKIGEAQWMPDSNIIWPGSVPIPCGRCVGCRLDYSRSWADRMMLELDTAGCGIFVTLTYNNENATWCKFDCEGNPIAATLVKEDVQLFMKRLRKHFTGKEIKFYLSGEYGTKTFRPHYHAIFFGIGLRDFSDLQDHGVNELGQRYFVSDSLARIWSNGFVLLSDVSWKTCAYVARYVMKKVGDSSAVNEYLGQIPEFSLMSRRPGLGKRYLDAHPDCFDFNSINISTPEGGRKIAIPKYFLRQLELTDKEAFDRIKKERRELAQDRELLKLRQTDLSYLDMLESDENSKLRSVERLVRESV